MLTAYLIPRVGAIVCDTMYTRIVVSPTYKVSLIVKIYSCTSFEVLQIKRKYLFSIKSENLLHKKSIQPNLMYYRGKVFFTSCRALYLSIKIHHCDILTVGSDV
jgi:hypothetical protein